MLALPGRRGVFYFCAVESHKHLGSFVYLFKIKNLDLRTIAQKIREMDEESFLILLLFEETTAPFALSPLPFLSDLANGFACKSLMVNFLLLS